jgi:hypothetical protein
VRKNGDQKFLEGRHEQGKEEKICFSLFSIKNVQWYKGER